LLKPIDDLVIDGDDSGREVAIGMLASVVAVLGLGQIGRQMPALLSFTFLDLKCGSASSRAVSPV
jgi:hypothetical protein